MYIFCHVCDQYHGWEEEECRHGARSWMNGVGTVQEKRSGLCLVILGGGGGSNWPPGILADPPTHPHQKIFPQEKNEIYQRGPNLEVDFRYTNFFLASDPPPPPPPRYSINQPLRKGLETVLFCLRGQAYPWGRASPGAVWYLNDSVGAVAAGAVVLCLHILQGLDQLPLDVPRLGGLHGGVDQPLASCAHTAECGPRNPVRDLPTLCGHRLP